MDRPSPLEQLYTWSRANPLTFDLVTVGTAMGLIAGVEYLSYGAPQALGSIALIGPLVWRRRHPVLTALLIGGAAFAQLVTHPEPLMADLAVGFALYSLVAYGPRWWSRLGIVVAAFGALMTAELMSGYGRSGSLVLGFAGMMLLASWALGTMKRLREREREQLEEKARLLELEREQEARLAANAERARIAREMHDVVAHSLSVTISQADGGRYAARADPAAAVAALETISVTGRQALNDMRALLGVLRQDDDRPMAPQPDTDTIPDLVEEVRAGGQQVHLEIAGRARKLPPGVALAAYRIVQESLTNVRKHAGPGSQAWVRLVWHDASLQIDVVDDGRGAGAAVVHARPAGAIPGTGQGLRGMQERATLHGGRLAAGPRPGGGFAVQAHLPYGRTAR